MFEVGFANLAFGCMGLLAVLAAWGLRAQALVLFGYALYLFQAACLHGYSTLRREEVTCATWRSTIGTLLYVVMMVFAPPRCAP
jgi:hypothetical protein